MLFHIRLLLSKAHVTERTEETNNPSQPNCNGYDFDITAYTEIYTNQYDIMLVITKMYVVDDDACKHERALSPDAVDNGKWLHFNDQQHWILAIFKYSRVSL